MKNTDFRFPYTDYSMPSGTSIGVHVVHLSFLWNIYKNRSLQRTATERIIFVPEKQKSGMCRIKSIWGMLRPAGQPNQYKKIARKIPWSEPCDFLAIW